MAEATETRQHPTLPAGWRMLRFDEIAENVNDRVDDPSEAGVEYYVGLEHLDPESLHIRRWGHPTDVAATKLRFKPGDIIFGRRRAYQRKLAVAEFEGICSAHALVLRAREDVVLPEFLPFFMQSDLFFDRALEISVGSLSPTINWTTLAKQEFPLPPKDEQRRIAELLWAADEVLRVNEEVESRLRPLLAQSFAELTSGFPLWPLEEALIQIIPGRSPVGSNDPATETGFGVLKVSAISEWGFIPEENKALLDPDDFIEDYEVKPGYLLVTRANAALSGVGRACLVQETRPGLMLSDKTLRLVVDESVANPRFLLQGLKSRECRRYIERVLGGTDAKNISQARLRKAPVPLPSLDQQAKIVASLEMIDNRIVHTVKHRANLQYLKKNLLTNYLSGGTFDV